MTERYVADYVAPMDEGFSLYAPGYVEVDGGLVTAVGPADGAPPPGSSPRVHRLEGLVLPGLVNGHAHSPMTVLRGAGEGLPLQRWLTEAVWPREARLTPDDVAVGMRAGAAELLRGGVTTTNEMYFFPEAVVHGAMEAGIRLIVSAAIVDAPGLERFGTPEQAIAATLDLRSRHADADLVEVGFGPHAAYTLRDQTLAEIGMVASREKMAVHIHVSETRAEGDPLAERTGMTASAHLAGLGVFEARAVAAHCVWVTGEDIRVLAERRVGVAHCPGSNGKLASGIAPVLAMRRAGIAVGVATDGPASNNNLDLLEEARLAVLYSRLRETDAASLGVEDALRMMTCDAAAALGREDLGALVPGRRADMIRVSLADLGYRPVVEPPDILAHFVWAGSSRDVRDVWVGGRRVVEDAEPIEVDLAETRCRLDEIGARIAG